MKIRVYDSSLGCDSVEHFKENWIGAGGLPEVFKNIEVELIKDAVQDRLVVLGDDNSVMLSLLDGDALSLDKLSNFLKEHFNFK